MLVKNLSCGILCQFSSFKTKQRIEFRNYKWNKSGNWDDVASIFRQGSRKRSDKQAYFRFLEPIRKSFLRDPISTHLLMLCVPEVSKENVLASSFRKLSTSCLKFFLLDSNPFYYGNGKHCSNGNITIGIRKVPVTDVETNWLSSTHGSEIRLLSYDILHQSYHIGPKTICAPSQA